MRTVPHRRTKATAAAGASKQRRPPTDPDAAYHKAKTKSLSYIAEVMAKAKASGVGGAAITYDDLQTIHQNFHDMISLHPTLGPSYTDLVNGKTPDFESMSLDSSFFPATLQHTHQTQMHPPPAVNGRHSQDSIAAPAEGSQPSHKDPHHAQPVYGPNPDFPLSNVSQYSLQPSMTQFNLSFTESEPPLAISQPMAQPVLPPSTFGGGQMPLAAAGSQNGHWKDKLLQDIYQELMTAKPDSNARKVAVAALRAVLRLKDVNEQQPPVSTSRPPPAPLPHHSKRLRVPPGKYQPQRKVPYAHDISSEEVNAAEALTSMLV